MTMIPFLEKLPNPDEAKELQRFVPSVVASYIANDNDIINLDIDYSLYEILYNLGQGYIQTADDRNNHADFISFANRMLQTGKMKESVTILSEKGVKAVVSKTAFGFRFKVVK
jgi:DNA phosphorothioation-dependent restriction protein DptF